MKAKTTLSIDHDVLRRVKERAAREGTTTSALVETALRRPFDEHHEARKPRKRIRIRSFRMGIPRVDVSDRMALYDLMDEYDRGVRR